MDHIKLPVFYGMNTCTCIENFIQIEICKFADQCLFDIKDYVYSVGEKSTNRNAKLLILHCSPTIVMTFFTLK